MLRQVRPVVRAQCFDNAAEWNDIVAPTKILKMGIEDYRVRIMVQNHSDPAPINGAYESRYAQEPNYVCNDLSHGTRGSCHKSRCHRNLAPLCEKTYRIRLSLLRCCPFTIIAFGNFDESIRHHKIGNDHAAWAHAGQDYAEFSNLIIVA